MVPVLNEFKAWLDQQSLNVVSQGYFSKAVFYSLRQRERLTVFLQDGRLEIDNNKAERVIRLYVTGRVNWIFCNTPDGAIASAVIYSIVITTKENGLIPYEYLKYLFEVLPDLDPDKLEATDILDQYMPWSPSLPDYTRHPSFRQLAQASADDD